MCSCIKYSLFKIQQERKLVEEKKKKCSQNHETHVYIVDLSLLKKKQPVYLLTELVLLKKNTSLKQMKHLKQKVPMTEVSETATWTLLN